jgi:hypothetical protein
MAAAYPLANDVVIRRVNQTAPGEYVLVNAFSGAVVAGPFGDMATAARTARDLAAHHGITVWHEQLDERGRPVGPATPLFSPAPSTARRSPLTP